MCARSRPMVRTSASSGTLPTACSPSASSDAAMAGSAAFFAPETCTSPRSGTPPSMTILSIRPAGEGEYYSVAGGECRTAAVDELPCRSGSRGRPTFPRLLLRSRDDDARQARQVAPRLGGREPGREAERGERSLVTLVHLDHERATGTKPRQGAGHQPACHGEAILAAVQGERGLPVQLARERRNLGGGHVGRGGGDDVKAEVGRHRREEGAEEELEPGSEPDGVLARQRQGVRRDVTGDDARGRPLQREGHADAARAGADVQGEALRGG